MHSNSILPMADNRHFSPQTTNSSGYHSDLSLATESPQSVKENLSTLNIESNFVQSNKNIDDKKSFKSKNITRLSSYLHKQYERAKSKLVIKKQLQFPIKLCSKATSTTPLSHLADNNNHIKLPKSSTTTFRQNSPIEPSKLHSIHVYPLHDKHMKISSRNYASIHQCLSYQPSSHRLLSYSKLSNSQIDSHSHQRLTTMINYQNFNSGCLENNNRPFCHQNYSTKPTFSQSYYPYKYLHKNYDFSRSSYAPLSDFICTKDSAFKPFKFYQRPSRNLSELIPPSDDPCDLEVAQYFHQTPQWSNPNYFDIYSQEASSRKNYSETLC
ncbi:unnamed protein product [Rotaria socialis]|uniref:Uncharacterized protein n=1 Tax=Rotaria socialis TaxID=392032 RepID=A0A817SI79_9BILA|nr:unnamed protein product [Rotaria socialis]CAF3295250.1 unnamed protein product [Rotaria socialis]CAF3436753.1 unnamed protein product [Rotaria socialis]CAF4213490.1 unnamed protein product [Rotaria socialis]CAF4378980.1 unnamed protein product [Rotaria socialis]